MAVQLIDDLYSAQDDVWKLSQGIKKVFAVIEHIQLTLEADQDARPSKSLLPHEIKTMKDALQSIQACKSVMTVLSTRLSFPPHDAQSGPAKYINTSVEKLEWMKHVKHFESEIMAQFSSLTLCLHMLTSINPDVIQNASETPSREAENAASRQLGSGKAGNSTDPVNVNVTRQLVSHGFSEGSALVKAVELDLDFLVSEYVEFGADATIQDHQGWTLLHLAASKGSSKALKTLLSMPLRWSPDFINTRNDHGETALILAAKEAHRQASPVIAEALIAKGCNVNIPDDRGRTALSIINQQPYNPYRHQFVTLLVANGADTKVI